MILREAYTLAEKLKAWIAPECEAVEIAGSVRRGRPNCNDIDLVCVPRVFERDHDLLGVPQRLHSDLHAFLCQQVEKARGKVYWREATSAPPPTAQIFLLQGQQCALDIFCATPATFATRLLCRTGSKEHNVWLCQRARQMGMKWNPAEGVLVDGMWNDGTNEYEGGRIHPTLSEAEIYDLFGLDLIPPAMREAPLRGWEKGSSIAAQC